MLLQNEFDSLEKNTLKLVGSSDPSVKGVYDSYSQ